MFVTKQKFGSIIDQLKSSGVSQIELYGVPVDLKYRTNDAKLSLSTSVYRGGNFIPLSVRGCLQETPPLPPTSIHTYLSINEKEYQIMLNYLENIDHIDYEEFRNILEEFGKLAEEWRFIIDDHDKRDLIHVRK